MKKKKWFLLIFLLIVLVTYFSGPKIPEPTFEKRLPKLPENLEALDYYVRQQEARQPIRQDNQARILWQDDSLQVTEYSLVYLHGFAGSYRDGYPVNVEIADTLGANLYLSRWAGHGLNPPASLVDFSADTAWDSAKEAFAIGRKIGEKVIIMSTSTGGTLAMQLARTYPDQVHALINMSPNVEDDVDGAFVLNSPWGYELAYLASLGSEKKIEHNTEMARQYWDTRYPSKALVDLQVLISTTMDVGTFNQITCPVLTLFYYDHFLREDDHVEVEDYPEVHRNLRTPDSLKKLVALETPRTHYIGSGIKSKNTQVVVEEIVEFLTNNLGIDLN